MRWSKKLASCVKLKVPFFGFHASQQVPSYKTKKQAGGKMRLLKGVLQSLILGLAYIYLFVCSERTFWASVNSEHGVNTAKCQMGFRL